MYTQRTHASVVHAFSFPTNVGNEIHPDLEADASGRGGTVWSGVTVIMKLHGSLGFLLASLAVACGGNNNENGSIGGSTIDGTGGSGVGGGSTGGGSSTGGSGTGGGGQTLGSCGLNTGFEGDDYCIPPPDPTMGIQIHVGPSNYDDPAALAPYLIDPGAENVVCYNAPIPESDLYYMGQSNRMRPHSHHMRIFVNGDLNAQAGPAGCLTLGFGSSGMIPGSQSPSWDSQGSTAPEDAGLARYLPKATMANFEIHYINDTTHQVLREAWVNLYKVPQDQITQHLNMIMMVGDLTIYIPPHTVQDTPVTLTPAISSETRLFDVTAHMHAHAEQYTLSVQHAGTTSWEQIYQTFNWEEPLTNVFNSVVNNPTPDPTTKRDGGLSGPYYLQPGDTLKWVCHVNNTLDTAIRFANEAQTAEMCMLTGDYIAPANGIWTGFCSNGRC